MQTFIGIGVIILCLMFVIGIHELGHSLTAKILGLEIKKVNLGFGRQLFKWHTKSGYEISISPLLIGGRVDFYNNRVSKVPDDKQIYALDRQPVWIRILILLSGSIANILLAFFALIFMFSLGYKQVNPVITAIKPNSSAAIAGLKVNSKIISIAMQKTPYFRDVAIQLIMNLGKSNVPISFCDSENICQQSTINLNLWHAKPKQLSMFAAIGFTPGDIEKNRINVPGVNFSTAVKNSFSDLLNLTKFFVIMIKQILTGNIPFATLIGPFKFFEAIIDSFQQGLTTFLYFIVNFSLAMAIANLLPIPSLDGGGIIYCLLEKIRGKPLSIALEELIYRLVFIAFAMFFTQLIVNDLKYYF